MNIYKVIILKEPTENALQAIDLLVEIVQGDLVNVVVDVVYHRMFVIVHLLDVNVDDEDKATDLDENDG